MYGRGPEAEKIVTGQLAEQLDSQLDLVHAVFYHVETERVDNLGSASFDAFQAGLRGCIEPGANTVIVDMGKVQFISEIGIRELLLLQKKLKEIRPTSGVVLLDMTGRAKAKFDYTGFIDLFPSGTSKN